MTLLVFKLFVNKAVTISLLTDPFVKVYLLQDGKKISKKKTSMKRDDTNPIFNEAMIFSVPAVVLQVTLGRDGTMVGNRQLKGLFSQMTFDLMVLFWLSRCY
jgi:hypothetical protein